MRNVFVLSVALFLFTGFGCARSVRYSAEEIKDFPPSVQEQIRKGEISPGMTMAQVRYAWGAPDKVIPLAPDEKGKEQVEWVFYKGVHVSKSKLVFAERRLTEIQTTEPGF